MKIIHTSDIHLDSPMTTRLSHVHATERKREIFATFRRIVDTAVSDGYSAVIIAGDLFDNERVGVRTLDAVIGAIENARDVTFFYLPGNHEKQRLVASGLPIPENLKIFGEDWTYFKLDGITFAGRSDCGDDMFDSLELKDEDINILVLHGDLLNRPHTLKGLCGLDVERHPVDYIALGHFHTYQKERLSKRTTAVYCGTPEGRGFDETGEKGYVAIDISEHGTRTAFIPAASRIMQIIEVNISGTVREIEIENKIAEALARVSRRDLVRVVLTGTHTPETKRNTDALELRFASQFYYFEVRDESKLTISSAEYKNDKTLKGEFIRLVLGRDDLSDEDKSDIIECGIRALAGEAL